MLSIVQQIHPGSSVRVSWRIDNIDKSGFFSNNGSLVRYSHRRGDIQASSFTCKSPATCQDLDCLSTTRGLTSHIYFMYSFNSREWDLERAAIIRLQVYTRQSVNSAPTHAHLNKDTVVWEGSYLPSKANVNSRITMTMLKATIFTKFYKTTFFTVGEVCIYHD